MKIAICISGFLRTWEYTKKSFIEQLLQDKDNEYDLFIHTYYQNLYEFTAEKKDILLTKKEIEDLFEGLNVRVLIIENRDELLPLILKESEKYSHISNYNLKQLESSDNNSKTIPIGARTYDHLRKIHLCNESRRLYEQENNITYDLVVKTRFDLCYFNSPDWKACLDGKVYFEYGACFGWPDDIFCITIPYVMDNWYANRFTKFDEMFITGPNIVQDICSHATLKWILEKGNIEISTNRIINTSCFRSENSMQFYDNYKKKYNINNLYNQITSVGLKNVYEIEKLKISILN